MRFKLNELLIFMLIILIVSLPTSIATKYAINIFNISFRLDSIIIMLTIPFLLILNLFKNESKKNFEYIYILFLFYNCLNSLLKSFNKPEVLLSFFNTFLIIYFPYLLYRFIKNYCNLQKYFKYLLIIGNFIAFQPIYANLFKKSFTRITNFNSLESYGELIRTRTTIGAATISAIFLFSVSIIAYIEFKKKPNLFNKISIVLLSIGILLLFSRASIISFMLFIFYFLMLFKKQLSKNRKLYFGILIFIGIVLILNSSIFNVLWARLSGETSGNSNSQRIFLMTSGIDMFLDSPITGVGLGNGYSRVNDNLNRIIGNPHNLHITFLLETGLIGYSLLVAFLLNVFIKYRVIIHKSDKAKLIFWGLIILTLFTSQFESYYLASIPINIIFWSIILYFEYISKEYLEYRDVDKNLN